MVEHQAIARVQRLGQTEVVRVIRYIVKGTVEEVSFAITMKVMRTDPSRVCDLNRP